MSRDMEMEDDDIKRIISLVIDSMMGTGGLMYLSSAEDETNEDNLEECYNK